MRKITALYLPGLDRPKVALGCSGWGKTWDDKVLGIECTKIPGDLFDDYEDAWLAGSGMVYLVKLMSGMEVFIKAEAVVAVEYEEVQD